MRQIYDMGPTATFGLSVTNVYKRDLNQPMKIESLCSTDRLSLVHLVSIHDIQLKKFVCWRSTYSLSVQKVVSKCDMNKMNLFLFYRTT